jgi:hypothetical protein
MQLKELKEKKEIYANWQETAMRERIASNQHFNIQSAVINKANLVVINARE